MYARILEAILALGLIVGAWLYAGHHAVEAYKKDQQIEQAAATKKQQDAYDDLATRYETLKDTRAANAKTIIKEVEKVVAGDVVYRNVCISDNGMQLANQALAGQSASSANAKVHSPDTP